MIDRAQQEDRERAQHQLGIVRRDLRVLHKLVGDDIDAREDALGWPTDWARRQYETSLGGKVTRNEFLALSRVVIFLCNKMGLTPEPR
jgi:hypothetical protein